MVRGVAGACCALIFCLASVPVRAEPQSRYDDIIARLAKAHDVPADFVHRIVKRESRYNPGLVHRQCYGLMQIKHATARAMGYQGPAHGLLDPEVNLAYGVPYLANAYRLADGNTDRAVRLYSSGYYYFAKRSKRLAELRTASSPDLRSDPPPRAPQNPIAQALSFLAGSSPSPAYSGPGR